MGRGELGEGMDMCSDTRWKLGWLLYDRHAHDGGHNIDRGGVGTQQLRR